MPETPPVCFIIFNRPTLTQRVFQEIRRALPPVLLVVADGPRDGNIDDISKCQAARAVIDQVDWPCEVLKNFSNTNMGLRQRISSGITWVFEQVEEAVVLEDDCVPHPSFFPYTHQLLDRYRNDERVISISGGNYQLGRWRGTGSYYFSKYSDCWGWATWRRGWQAFDLSMSSWPEFRDSGGLRSVCPDPVEHDYWYAIFEATHAGKVNSWAYAWVFAAFLRNRLSPHPNVNLISNIGVGMDATHITGEVPFANLPTADIGALQHPSSVVADWDADRFEFDFTHGGAELRRRRTLLHRVRGLRGRLKRNSLAPLKRWLLGQ